MKPPQRTYSEDELAALFATYFGDKLSQRQLDSLVVTVLQAHADRGARAREWAKDHNSALQPSHLQGPLASGQAGLNRFVSEWATVRSHQVAAPG